MPPRTVGVPLGELVLTEGTVKYTEAGTSYSPPHVTPTFIVLDAYRGLSLTLKPWQIGLQSSRSSETTGREDFLRPVSGRCHTLRREKKGDQTPLMIRIRSDMDFFFDAGASATLEMCEPGLSRRALTAFMYAVD